MTWRPGGDFRCASTTYAGRFVIEPKNFESFWSYGSAEMVTFGGNARQRRREVRRLRRRGFFVLPGGVAT